MPSAVEHDHAVRAAAFRFLEGLSARHGDSLPWSALQKGFVHEGERVSLVAMQGIFKPAVLPRLPLSIRTAAVRPGEARPYDDGLMDDGTLVYRYRGNDPGFYQNVWLREAMTHHVPMVYFHGTVPGRYVAQWPVFVVGEDVEGLAFRVDLDGIIAQPVSGDALDDVLPEPALERRYAKRLTRQRLHQGTFRDRVMKAYREQCAICRLRHVNLLDAAHILPDANPLGEPVVSNGLSLCKLHHAAYDQRILGIRPDLVVEVTPSILQEQDGPMLEHGLKEIHKTRLHVPRRTELQPDPERLRSRYAEFRETA
jgi:putative restriction endonuclease